MDKADKEMFLKIAKTTKNIFFGANCDYKKTKEHVYRSINPLYKIQRDAIMRDRSVHIADRVEKVSKINVRISDMVDKILLMVYTTRVFVMIEDDKPVDMKDKAILGKFQKAFEMINESVAYIDHITREELIKVFAEKLVNEIEI